MRQRRNTLYVLVTQTRDQEDTAKAANWDCLGQGFLCFNLYMNHLEILLKCSFWLSGSGLQILHVWHILKKPLVVTVLLVCDSGCSCKDSPPHSCPLIVRLTIHCAPPGSADRQPDLGTVLVSHGCCHKLPQTGWLITTEICSLTVPEARSSKLRHRQGCAPSRGSKGDYVPCPF